MLQDFCDVTPRPGAPLERGLAHATIAGMIWTLFGMGGQSFVRVVVLVVLARLLAPGDFGVMGAALGVISFVDIFAQFSIGSAVVQHPSLETRHVRTAFGASLLLGGIMTAWLWLVAPLAAEFFRMPELVSILELLSCVFLIRSFAVVAEAQLLRDLQFRVLSIRGILVDLVGYGACAIALAAAGWGVWALVIAQITQAALRTVTVLTLRPPEGIACRPSVCRELLRFGGGTTAASIANELALQGDKFIVARYLGPGALGLYGRAYQLMEAPGTLGELLDRVLFPAMARIQQDLSRLAPAYRRGVAASAMVMGPVTILSVLLAPELIAVALGPQWTDAVVPFQVLATAMFFRTGYKLSKSVARAKGAVGPWATCQAAIAGAVVIAAWLGQQWGIVGVAFAVMVVLGLNWLLMTELALRLTGLRWGSIARAHVPALVFCAATGPAAWLTASLLQAAGLPPLLVLIGASTAAGLAAVAALRMTPRWILGDEPLGLGRLLQPHVPWDLKWVFDDVRS